jgi:hypothetical protein
MKIFKNVALATLLCTTMSGLVGCDTSTPAEPVSESTNIQDIKAAVNAKDFSFSVFNSLGLTIEIKLIDENGDTIPYPRAKLQVVNGDDNSLVKSMSTNENGVVLLEEGIVPASISKLGVAVLAATFPEDTLWYTNEELQTLDGTVIINPTSYNVESQVVTGTKVAAKGAVVAGHYVDRNDALPKKTVNLKHVDVKEINDKLFHETVKITDVGPTPAPWFETNEIRINWNTKLKSDFPDAKEKLWATFMHTGAGYHNEFGYYYYLTSENPNGELSKATKVTIFENVHGFDNWNYIGKSSMYGKVSEFKAMLTNPLDEVVIGFWLKADSKGNHSSFWGKSYPWYKPTWYSNTAWNLDIYDNINKHHMVNISPSKGDPTKYYLGIEDQNRHASDHDFNDLIVLIDVLEEASAPCTGTYEECYVICENDTTNYNDRRIGFEDNYPEQGDYDFNDLIVDYDVQQVNKTCWDLNLLTTTRTVEAINLTAQPVANGAFYELGFGIALNIPSAGNANETIVDFFESARLEFAGVTDIFVNTKGPVLTAPAKSFTVVPATTVDPDNFTLEINPFLFMKDNKSHEIHKKGYSLTSRGAYPNLANYDNPVAIDFGSTPFMETTTGLPWAIEIKNTTKYPVEFCPITQAYSKFASWANSNGTVDADWETTSTLDPACIYN